MSVFKCKMCGGSLEISEGMKVCECEYCGTTQTVPSQKDENIQALFNRANILRMKSEFDKAEQLYEKIIQNAPDEPEAHWGLILCKFGIEYVEDPATFKRIPTCHRTSFDSIIADDDYKEALRCANSVQRDIYEREAREIDRLQKEILALSAKEEPYDVFICYKESDNGSRTPDSVIANDIYYQLTNEGFKVFYAAISLENKLGSAYEPCIFAALNSAKVMLAIGTNPDYFNAVWVKNEWSRFLKMMKKDRSKLLIPCYKDMDAYELPEEFAHLQAQDMSKIGFINDLVRGIKKVIVKDEKKPAAAKTPTLAAVPSANPTVSSLLKRAFIFLEDGDWQSADEYCEKVLDLDPENGEAYLGKLMAEMEVRKRDDLKNCAQPFDGSSNFQKVMRYGDDALKAEMQNCTQYIKDRNHKAYQESVYQKAIAVYHNMSSTKTQITTAKSLFEAVSGYKDSYDYINQCIEKIHEFDYQEAVRLCSSRKAAQADFKKAITLFEATDGYRDSLEQITKCKDKIYYLDSIEVYKPAIQKLNSAKNDYKKGVDNINPEHISTAIESLAEAKDMFDEIVDFEDSRERRKECEELLGEYSQTRTSVTDKKQALDKAAAKSEKISKIAGILIIILVLAVAGTLLTTLFIIPESKYNNANSLLEAGKYEEAVTAFGEISSYRDSADKKMEAEKNISYLRAEELFNSGKYEEAAVIYKELEDFNDSKEKNDKVLEIIGFNKAEDAFQKLTDSEKKAFLKNRNYLSVDSISVGIKPDGTVVATKEDDEYDKGQSNVSSWNDIVKVCTDFKHTLGLRKDGKVLFAGDKNEKYDISEWTDMVDIATNSWVSIGLKKDGRVIKTKDDSSMNSEYNVSYWNNIVSIAAGYSHVVGLKSDGTVVATGNKDVGACDVSDWRDIVAIDAGDNYTVGLKSDGTVVTTELPEERDVGQCDVSDWKGIVAISVGDDVTIGLKADGTVCVTGGIINYDGNKKAWDKQIVNKKEISDWNEIVSVKTYIGISFVGVKSDGTVVSTSYKKEEYDGWKLKTVEK